MFPYLLPVVAAAISAKTFAISGSRQVSSAFDFFAQVTIGIFMSESDKGLLRCCQANVSFHHELDCRSALSVGKVVTAGISAVRVLELRQKGARLPQSAFKSVREYDMIPDQMIFKV